MSEFLDKLLSVFNYLFIPFFALGLLGMFVFKGIIKGETKQNKKFIWIGSILCAPIIIGTIICLVVGGILDIRARNKVINFLNQKNVTMEINDRNIPKDSSAIIIKDIQSIHRVVANHTGPRGNTYIKFNAIANNDTLHLILRQNYDIKNEYWVYWSKNKTENKSEFGRFNTSFFNFLSENKGN